MACVTARRLTPTQLHGIAVQRECRTGQTHASCLLPLRAPASVSDATWFQSTGRRTCGCMSSTTQWLQPLTACDARQVPLVFFGLNFSSQHCEDSADVSKSEAVITAATFEEDQKPSAPSTAATDCLRSMSTRKEWGERSESMGYS